MVYPHYIDIPTLYGARDRVQFLRSAQPAIEACGRMGQKIPGGRLSPFVPPPKSPSVPATETYEIVPRPFIPNDALSALVQSILPCRDTTGELVPEDPSHCANKGDRQEIANQPEPNRLNHLCDP